jgi:hypothetical protein
MPVFDAGVWELSDANSDWTPARDLAGEFPGMLRDRQRLLIIEAVKYGALPLDDRRAERLLAEIARRLAPVHARRDVVLLRYDAAVSSRRSGLAGFLA